MREMRRKDRALPEEEARRLLQQGVWGVLATTDTKGNPYATPLSYVVIDDEIFFHCAPAGQKIDNIHYNPRVCFCVTGSVQAVYDKNFTSYYESVMAFGTACPVESAAEKTDVLMQLAQKYLPAYMEKAPADIATSLNKTAVYKIKIEIITGKAKRSLS